MPRQLPPQRDLADRYAFIDWFADYGMPFVIVIVLLGVATGITFLIG